MNREQKLAIIIGFAVLLVVGVLLSDHWSLARQLEIADAAEGDAVQYTQQPVAVLTDPAIVLPTHSNQQATRLAESTALPEATPIVPIVIRQGATSPTFSADSVQPPAATSLASALESTAARQQGSSAAPQLDASVTADAGQSRPNAVSDMVSRLRESYAGSVPEAARVVGREPNLDALNHVPQGGMPKFSASPKAASSEMIRHKVASGETLSRIASKYLGSAGKWRIIAQANPKLVTADGRVREGATLLIPAKNVPREVAGQRAAHMTRKQSHKPTARAAGKSAKIKIYTVKKNDTLGQIAQNLLGSTRRINDILKANHTLITNPDDIRVGMVLKIPSA